VGNVLQKKLKNRRKLQKCKVRKLLKKKLEEAQQPRSEDEALEQPMEQPVAVDQPPQPLVKV